MGHGISIRKNGFAEMAFTGDTPWHGLGQWVTKGASIGVWTRESGMDWEASEGAVLYHANGDKVGALRSFEGKKVLYRSDTGAPLGVVSSGYNVVQPEDVMEFFRDLTEDAGWHIQTAGCLHGGTKLWVMAGRDDLSGFADTGKQGKRDRIAGRLLLATSLDGSMPTHAALVAERVVCANTFAVAMNEKGRKRIEIRHRSEFDADIIKMELGVAVDGWTRFISKTQQMAQTPIDTEEALEVLRGIFGRPEAKPALDLSWMSDDFAVGEEQQVTQKEARNTERALALFEGEGRGSDAKTSAGTRWGLFNAVTELVDHEMGRRDDTRLDSAWFGRGAQMKQKAFELLSE